MGQMLEYLLVAVSYQNTKGGESRRGPCCVCARMEATNSTYIQYSTKVPNVKLPPVKSPWSLFPPPIETFPPLLLLLQVAIPPIFPSYCTLRVESTVSLYTITSFLKKSVVS